MITSSLEVSIWPVQHAKRLPFICGLDHLSILKNVGEDLDTKNKISVNPISGRWQAPAAVLPEGPKNIGDSHSRARRAREWPKHASKAQSSFWRLPVLLYVFPDSAQNRDFHGTI